MSKYTFYSIAPLTRTEPTAVYRFPVDEDLSPEYYRAGIGWVKDDDLYLLIAKGHMSDADEIDEHRAKEIIARLTTL